MPPYFIMQTQGWISSAKGQDGDSIEDSMEDPNDDSIDDSMEDPKVGESMS